MKIFTIDQAETRRAIKALHDNERADLKAIETPLGEEDELTPELLDQCAKECRKKLKLRTGAEGESELVPLIHAAIRISHKTASNNGFWRWISVKYFFDVIQERHARGGALAHESNFGTKGKLESLIGRVWFRGEVAYVPDSDNPYILATRGDQDFWRSHILRKRYSNSRPFVRDLISFQFPDGEALLHSSSQAGIRELTKRIQAAHASNVLEIFDADSAYALLKRLSVGLEGQRESVSDS